MKKSLAITTLSLMITGVALVGAEPSGGEAPPDAADRVANRVRELTGAPTRIVWAEQKPGTKADPFTRAADLYLMGLCTEDGKGVRRILPDAGSYRRPVLSKDGKRIFFGSVPEKKIFAVDWSGGNRHPISSETSSVVDVWTDPGSGEEWVYAVIPAAADPTSGTLVRYGPGGKREQVWDKGTILELYAQLSPDGHMASVQNGSGSKICGMVELPNKGFQPAVNGCWPSMLPCVAPYRLWVFNGNHRSGNIFENPGSPDSQRRWSLDLGGAPLTRNMFECYHPRWSNHSRFLAVTSPYTFQEDGKLGKDDNTIARWNWKDEANLLPRGSENVQVSIGRLNDKLTAVEQWVQVTEDTRAGKWMPDVWIQTPGMAAAKAGQPSAKRAAAWPVSQGGLVFLWRNGIAGNEIRSPEGELIRLCQANPKGPAWFGPQNQLVLCGGMLVPKDADAPLLAACRKTNELTIEMLVTPALTETRERAALASFSDGKGSPNFTIAQEGDALFLTLTTAQAGKQELLLFRVNAGRTYHLTVSCRPGNSRTDSRCNTVVYVDGVRVKSTGSIPGDFGSWTAQPLVFGREGANGAAWQGTLEAIALYSRVLTEAEVQSHYKILGEALQTRKPPARVQVQAKLVATTQMPKDIKGALGTYPRALIVHTYEVDKVLSGTLPKAAKRILVGHWATLDWQTVLGTQKRGAAVGQVFQLWLEPWEAHPQLESDLTWNDSAEPTLPLFFDIFSDGSQPGSADNPAESGASLSRGLIGHWSFDETEGASAADSSGKGLHGKLHGNARFVAGRVNNGIELDGDGDWVQVATDSRFDFSTEDFSLSFWIYEFQNGIGCADFLMTSGGWGIRCQDQMGDKIGFQGKDHLERVVSAEAFAQDAWVHVVITRKSETVRIYQNGREVAYETNLPIGPIPAGPPALYFGREGGAGNGIYAAKCRMDEVRIYNRLLSTAEIKTLAAQSTPARDTK